MLLLLLVLVLIFGVPFGGSYYNGGVYRSYGFGLGGLLVVVLLILLLTGNLHI